MRRMVWALCALFSFAAVAATPTITGVTAQQRYPWNGKVDISYTVTGDIAEEAKQRAVLTSLKVSAIDMVANTTNAATQLSGDVSLEEGTHAIVWDMDAEGFPLPFKSSGLTICQKLPRPFAVLMMIPYIELISSKQVYQVLLSGSLAKHSLSEERFHSSLKSFSVSLFLLRNRSTTQAYFLTILVLAILLK